MTDLFDELDQSGFGDLHLKQDPRSGLRAIVAVHSTKLGPALGGCRFVEYASTADAVRDALRLAQGMSYKSALAGLPLGGGKAVIIKPNKAFDRQAYFHAFGDFVESLNGRYITAVDSGTELHDMNIIGQRTRYVASLSEEHGDPSPSTVSGILRGIEAAVMFTLDRSSLSGLKVAIQGLGQVGFDLAHRLHQQGARLTVADVNADRVADAVRRFSATEVLVQDIHKVPCDVFAPCALGGILNSSSIAELQTRIVAGGANNQLAEPLDGQRLHDRGILYAPDYVINAGGVIYASSKYFSSSEASAQQKINNIRNALLEIFNRSRQDNQACNLIADGLARELLA